MSAPSLRVRFGLRSIVLVYLAALIIVPVGMIFYRTFEHGLSQPIDAVTSRCEPSGSTTSVLARTASSNGSTPAWMFSARMPTSTSSHRHAST